MKKRMTKKRKLLRAKRQKTIRKILCLVLVVALNWMGFGGIHPTRAYFNDTESSTGNTYTAGTLDLAVSSGDWSPAETVLNLNPGDTVSKTLTVQNNGSLNLKYGVSVVKTSGDDDFCNNLNLSASLNGYNDSLMSFNVTDLLLVTSAIDTWNLSVTLPASAPEFTESGCGFDFVFDAWQENLTFGQGFSDTEEDSNYLSVTSKYSPIKDSHVRQDSAGSNYGSMGNLRVRSQSGSNDRRSYVKFNFNFPSGVTISHANLKLYMHSAPSASRSYDTYRVTDSWTESGVNWDNQPSVEGSPTATASIGTTAGQWVSWDVTADAQAFISGTTNSGWQIRDSSEGSSTAREALFYSRDYATNESLRPVLEISFTAPAATTDHLVVNEVYYNVASSGKGSESTNEWVEIYNPTDLAVDISGWQICDSTSCDTIPAGTAVIPAKGFAVFAPYASTWGFWSNIPAGAVKIVLGSYIGNGLSNTGDLIKLLSNDPGNPIIDQMSYGSNTTAFSPSVSLSGTGKSLARIIKGYDNDLNTDWIINSTPNPGTNPSAGGEEIMRFTAEGIEVASSADLLEPLPTEENTEEIIDEETIDEQLFILPLEEIAPIVEGGVLNDGSGATTDESIIPPPAVEEPATGEVAPPAVEEPTTDEPPVGDAIENPEPDNILPTEPIENPAEAPAEIPVITPPSTEPEEIIITPPPTEEVVAETNEPAISAGEEPIENIVIPTETLSPEPAPEPALAE